LLIQISLYFLYIIKKFLQKIIFDTLNTKVNMSNPVNENVEVTILCGYHFIVKETKSYISRVFNFVTVTKHF